MIAGPEFDHAVERFTALAATALEGQQLDVWPYSSGADCTDARAAGPFVRQHVHLLRQAGVEIRGSHVLEAGCGLGFALVVCVLLGADRAEGIEFTEEAAQAAESYLPSLPRDVASRISVRQGDASDMPYRDRSFDVLLSIEAISHYLNVPGFLAEAARVLKPGGVLIISDGNNGSNPLLRRKTKQIWQAFEQAPSGTRIHGHTVTRSYETQRADAIVAAFPELGENALMIARSTAGFTFAETIEAARRFVRDGELPDSPYRPGDLAISPVGMAMERLFRPFALARELERGGFRAKAYGYWGGASGRWHLRAANRILTAMSALTLPTAPGFRIVARKL